MTAGYCASSTECSDHSLKITTKKVFFKLRLFFLQRGVTKGAEQKTRDYAYSTVIVQQDCSYQGEALNVPTAFKVYGAVITLKN